MKANRYRVMQLKKMSKAISSKAGSGDPRSLFYGDPVEVTPDQAAEAVGHQTDGSEVVDSAIVDGKSDDVAAQRLAAYEQMSASDRAQVTYLPALATWNAFTVINPQIGKVQATSLDYMLLKSLNDYPYEGGTTMGKVGDDNIQTVTLTGSSSLAYVVPFFRFTIASSTLQSQPGAQIKIYFKGVDPQGHRVDTSISGSADADGRIFSIQRLNNTEAIVGVYIPTVLKSTRTLPFLPLVDESHSLEITFEGVPSTDQVSVTVPGYSTAELKDIARMYNLPSGDVR